MLVTQIYFANLSEALPQAKAGQVRVIAVSSEQRIAQLPDVPTVAESGYPNFRTLTWNGLLAPAGTPAAIINKIAAEVGTAVKDPAMKERFVAYGVDAVGAGVSDDHQSRCRDVVGSNQACGRNAAIAAAH
jgi:tripartite-type tricarboxylate transporter receptor subunit TctC